MRIERPDQLIVAGGMARKERRKQVLAERKLRKKDKAVLSDELFAWMAGLLPATGGSVLEVGAGSPGQQAALEARGWRVVIADAGAVLAPGVFGGEPVDAVTCWLLEVPRRPDVAARLDAMGLRTEDEARLALQTLVYRLADRVLRPGGVLQIVDRTTDAFDESLATGVMRLQRAQAKGTALEFASIDAKPFGRGALVSVRSRKV
jgi:hypothetical protein